MGRRGRGPRRKFRAAWLAGLVAIAVGGVLAAFTIAKGDSGGGASAGDGAFAAQGGAGDDSSTLARESARRHLVAHIRGSRLLYDRPDGEPLVRIAGKTQWDSPRILRVVKRRDGWVAVLAPELKNGMVGWMRLREVSMFDTVSWSLHVDLSKRLIVVRRAGRPMRRVHVGIGRPGHSTPRGRFAVTDRLRVRDPSSPYGCCVLALTGHQTRLPPGWPGGDRLAVHATSDLSGIGREVSLGCMRAHPRDAGWLIRKIPLGSPVFIHA